MIKEILTYPKDKEILTQKSEKIEEITDEIKELATDLIDTLKSTKTGVGISAVQIGVLKKMCIIKDNMNYIVMINPQITRERGAVLFEEGCLSAPKATKKVMRAQKVWCTYTDLNGNRKEIDQGGLVSIIIQHELDHFDGWCEVFDNVKVEEKENEI
jgi:peptide deformylase